MAKTTRKSLTEAASKELKSAFSLDKFKANKGLASNVKFKDQKWTSKFNVSNSISTNTGLRLF